ncbi:thioredoxin family protein [Ornithinibacillus salinisoli]|uniref:Thioredoxin family protein n=1 Tax=Ornithinibacillus salinisoli TaxID=1848459 RepID=A0ABW4W340_9BACI
MQEINNEILLHDSYLLFIHTPFCGTCHLTRSMIHQIEKIHQTDIFHEMNASLYPQFMLENQVESVPCLLIKHKEEVVEKIYAFQSIPNVYQYVMKYRPELFEK